MEKMNSHTFSPKERGGGRGFNYWPSSSSSSCQSQTQGQAQMEASFSPSCSADGGMLNTNFGDPFTNILDFMNFDMDPNISAFSPSNFSQDEVALQANNKPSWPMDGLVTTNLASPPCRNISNAAGMCGMPMPLGFSLTDRMLRALSLFKESSGGGILAQVWVPIKQGDDFFLSTYEQPYLLDNMLAGYREVSRTFTFAAKEAPARGYFLGLPGRVFTSRMPEWTSNVVYYSKAEYLRVQHAVDHQVRGSLALPVLDSNQQSCCAVLELVTMKEKPNFDLEMENVSRALQAVNLRTTSPPWVHPQCLSKNQKAALAEIVDILRVVCHAHSLPLALTWIPASSSGNINDECTRVCIGEANKSFDDKNILCIEQTACYVSSTNMHAFVHACSEHYLKKGQGMAGKALESNHPFFSPDVKGYDIRDYPLVHHARKFGLNAAVAIRLRSIYTGNDDYILEFFLPVNCKGSAEQQLLLNSLSSTMQKICRSLRTVSDAELVGTEDVRGICEGKRIFPSTVMHGKSSQLATSEREFDSSENVSLHANSVNVTRNRDVTQEQKRHLEKKRSTVEKNISLSVLQQYFSGSLKDAAKSIGVCPTTLKRICRQHGISRWPSRKINKVNRSLRKIQTVIDSVQGVEGKLKFDPITGGLVPATSMVQGTEACNIFSPHKNSIPRNSESAIQDVTSSSGARVKCERPPLEMEANECSLSGHQVGPVGHMFLSTAGAEKEPKMQSVDCSNTYKFGASNTELVQPLNVEMPWAHSEDALRDPSSAEEKGNKWGLSFECSDCHLNSLSSSSMEAANEMDIARDGDDGVVEHNQPSSSSTTDSSIGSGSMMNGSASSSPNYTQRLMKSKISINRGSAITMKATYKEDTVRFKFEPCNGCPQLFEEVGKRFKLPTGTFQLKYLDDENEWVMLVSDADLQECLDILESVGSHSVKLLVRDTPCTIGSSTSSNCLLAGSS